VGIVTVTREATVIPLLKFASQRLRDPDARGLTTSGAEGALRWAYHWAGTLRDWTITRAADRRWTLKATVVHVDSFKVSQRPLTFVASNGGRWPIHSLHRSGPQLTATLGPQETE
jgi:hypothetical protein